MCHAKINENEKYCANCGKKITEEKVGNSRRSKNKLDVDNHLMELFIGEKKQTYYLRKWSKGLNTWNWAAFFFPIFWLGYRKMYEPIFIILGIYLVVDLAVTILGINDTVINSYLGIVVGISFGIISNNLYRLHTIKKIREITKRNLENPELLLNEIQSKGGVSWKGFFVSLGLFSIYIILAMCIFTLVPSMNNKVETIKDSDIESIIIDVPEENTTALENEPTYKKLQAPSMFDFHISDEIDINNDGIPEIVSFKGGPEENESYVNEKVEILVEFESGAISSVSEMAENAPVIYFYDINLDGWMEMFYETGARITGTDMYQFTPDGLVYVKTFNGSIEKLSEFEVFTTEDYYNLDNSLKVTNHP